MKYLPNEILADHNELLRQKKKQDLALDIAMGTMFLLFTVCMAISWFYRG